ncbi:unnamed protein product [Pleuronectes platessa]|uniref:Uncharacterized protein n=1 Tax=Pleuronectes platessa TaxID=8262 RepID=A0A9N7YCH5_PLEPL|nr:unnamed protein product [Pleuronectes platessa]
MPKPSIPSRPKTTEGQTAVTRASASANIETDKDSPIQPDAPPDKTYAMFKEMSESVLRCINERFDAFETKFNALAASQSELQARVASQEQAVTELDARMVTLEARHSELAKCNTQLHAKVQDLEARSRRHNVKIVGIQEVKVDRAHRSLQPKPAAGAKPRTILAPRLMGPASRLPRCDAGSAGRRCETHPTIPGQALCLLPDGEAPMIFADPDKQRGSWKGTT